MQEFYGWETDQAQISLRDVYDFNSVQEARRRALEFVYRRSECRCIFFAASFTYLYLSPHSQTAQIS